MLYRIVLVFLLFTAYSCATQQDLNFADDISPIIHKNCTPCHLPGEAAPYTLVSYSDIKSKTKLIRHLINDRLMPPWPADPDYRHFCNEYYLSNDEIESINQWIEKGMHSGDTTKIKTVIDFTKQKELLKPDMIIKVPKVNIPGDNQDLFLVMKIPYELPNDTFIKSIEFVPGNRTLVHHVNTHLIQYDEFKKKNINEGDSVVEQNQENSHELHRQLGILHDDGTYPSLTPSVSNYLPGARFSEYPQEIGGYKITKKGAFYLNDFHYGPTPVDALDSSYYKVYFADRPPIRPVREFQLGTLGLAPVEPELIINPGEVKTFHIKAVMPDDISLISIVPHMHLIGKSYWAYAVKPDGDTIPLIRIKRWDFRWQFFYQFKSLLHIPRGTTIFVEGVYDNTSENPNNPFNPPQVIRDRGWGSMRTTDEMFQFIVTYVPYQKGDENIKLESKE